MSGMMEWFPLDIFPTGGLASSVVTTVWIGATVVAFFNLRFGTTLSGLVVPGYLIPLFLVKPVAGWIILVESIATYFLARFIAERGLIRLNFAEMFGRDRFFILILCSILVRILFDVYLLPLLEGQLELYGASYELRSNLHSFGLIIIALCANQFWNGGFKIGAYTLTAYLLVTYAIVQFILIPLTNFNISTLGYMYEDIASSILASPKAYIILVTAAFISSRLNLRYGWDFNGILIPSLLALQWYVPLKILSTFVEAFVILGFAILLLKTPFFKNRNIEGARQLLFFFNIGFLYKLLLGYVVINWLPQQKITDLYGFGYLLSTLIALKMYDKGIAVRMTRTTLQTSLFACVVASITGFILTLYQPSQLALNYIGEEQVSVEQTDKSLNEFTVMLRQQSFASNQLNVAPPLSPLYLEQFRELVVQADKLTLPIDQVKLNRVAFMAQQFGFKITVIDNTTLAIHDSISNRGWGFYLINLSSASKLSIQVPTAMEEPTAAMAATQLYKSLQARYLAVTTARAKRSKDGSDNVLLNSQTLFQYFHQALTIRNTLQVRAYNNQLGRLLFGQRRDSATFDYENLPASLWVKKGLPDDLSLNQLKSYIGEYNIQWKTPDFQNRQRDVSASGFAELFLSPDDVTQILTRTATLEPLNTIANQQRITGYLQSYLQTNKIFIAPKFSQRYQTASQAELLFIDQSILQPLLSLIDNFDTPNWHQQSQGMLQQISQACAQIGYELLLYKEETTKYEYLILRELANLDLDQRRYWGTYVFKLGKASPFIFEVPSPIFESGTFELGGTMFQQMQARALLLSGNHPRANADGSSILTITDNKFSLFNLVHQGLLRHYRYEHPLATQIRGYTPADSSSDAKIQLAHYEDGKPSAGINARYNQLERALEEIGLLKPNNFLYYNDARTTQAKFTQFIPEATYLEVRLPTEVRRRFTAAHSDSLLNKQFSAFQIDQKEIDLLAYLPSKEFAPLPEEIAPRLTYLLTQYLASQNIQFLANLIDQFPQFHIEVWRDSRTQQDFLALKIDSLHLALLVSLNPLQDQDIVLSVDSQVNDDIVRQFAEQRLRWIYRKGS